MIRGDVLLMYVIYKDPTDMPIPGFVVRAWVIEGGNIEARPSVWAVQAPTLESARLSIPEGLYRLDRSPDDDPSIVETWL